MGQGHELRKSQVSWDGWGLIEHLLDSSGDLSVVRQRLLPGGGEQSRWEGSVVLQTIPVTIRSMGFL